VTTEELGNLLVYAAAPATTLLPVLYWITARWWKSLAGWALMTAKVGLAMLVDLSLLFRRFGPAYPHRQDYLLAAFAVITVGAYLYLAVFLRIQYTAWRRRRGLP
jgi:hypothetical protein